MTGKLPSYINALLLILMIGGSIAVWEELPERIPIHFSIDGTPDSWDEKSMVSWLMLPMIATALTVLMYGIGVLIVRRPDVVNMPDQKKYLNLPAESKRKVLGSMQVVLSWVGVMLNVTFVLVQFGSYRAAVGRPMPGLILAGVLLGIVTSPMLAVVALLRMQTLIDKESRN